MKKKIKTTWHVFGAKRRVSISKLLSDGKFSDYVGYQKYCEVHTVLPVSPAEFESQVPTAASDASTTAETETLSVVSHETDQAGLEATVWLAGVKDDPLSDPPEEKRLSKKKSKSQDPRQE